MVNNYSDLGVESKVPDYTITKSTSHDFESSNPDHFDKEFHISDNDFEGFLEEFDDDTLDLGMAVFQMDQD